MTSDGWRVTNRVAAFVASMLFVSVAAAQELRVETPPGWGKSQEVLRQRIDLGEVVASIPANQDMRTWTDGMEVTTLNIQSKSAETVAISAIQETYKMSYAACEKLNVVPPKVRQAGDLAVAYGHAFCQANKQHRKLGRVESIKAIASSSRVYIVKLIRVVPALRIPDSPADGKSKADKGDKEAKEAAAWLARTEKYLASSVMACSDKSTKKEQCTK